MWSLIETDFTIWRSTTERLSSGSSTGRRASMTDDSVGNRAPQANFHYGASRILTVGRTPVRSPEPVDVRKKPAESGFSADEFSASVSALANAFGDPTRREIYLFLREGSAGRTCSEVAEHFELHPNVARHTSTSWPPAATCRWNWPGASRPGGRRSATRCGRPPVTG